MLFLARNRSAGPGGDVVGLSARRRAVRGAGGSRCGSAERCRRNRVVGAIESPTLSDPKTRESPTLSDPKTRAIALGPASRGIKVFIRARGAPVFQIKAGHPFGYLDTEFLSDDGTQLMIGFGIDARRCDPADARRCDAADVAALQAMLDSILPGYEVLDAAAHGWLANEFSRGTRSIHRPGWYEHHYAAMQQPEGRVLLAGSDLANGWAGFIDGAIESSLRAGAWAARVSR